MRASGVHQIDPDIQATDVVPGKTRCIICSISIELRFKSFYFDTLLTFSTLSDLPLIYLMRTSNTFDIDYNNPNVDWNNWPMWQNISDLCYGIGANKDFIVPKRFQLSVQIFFFVQNMYF